MNVMMTKRNRLLRLLYFIRGEDYTPPPVPATPEPAATPTLRDLSTYYERVFLEGLAGRGDDG